MMPPRIAEARKNVLRENDVRARDLRLRFDRSGVFVVSVVSSPGAGKTSLLQGTLKELSRTRRVAALVGDLATAKDADRLAESGAPVRQITTGTVCHLDAAMVSAALDDWTLDCIDMLFIENVGNLVCPASYDLGEAMRVVLLSVTEGEDKPVKYPTIFHGADLAVITKIDLADAVEFDRARALSSLRSVRPDLDVLEVSARSGMGMAEWLERLISAASPRAGRAGEVALPAPVVMPRSMG